ncbi:MAG TPA: glycosyltransferase family 2 protein [Acetobacteraceae bacterium]|nr:glycosyltransferase family 2 protein [Acetobacteraceae bacterium]
MLARAEGEVAVLLSTWNGGRFLPAQLDSLMGQTHADWRLVWRDDGSTDDTVGLIRDFACRMPAGRFIEAEAPGLRRGVTASFLFLLRDAIRTVPGAAAYAFADQDDVWLPEKVARGAAALAAVEGGMPALYCARQVLVDQDLARIGESGPLRDPPGFPAALTQNIATGCTVMLNQAAARLVAASEPPAMTLHDWWSYLMVAAAGGRLIADDAAVVLYRQHGGNAVGAPPSMPQRAAAALRRGPALFMSVFRGHVAALRAQPHLLSPQAARDVARIEGALRRGVLPRLACLATQGLRRQTWPETMLFRLWFVIG